MAAHASSQSALTKGTDRAPAVEQSSHTASMVAVRKRLGSVASLAQKHRSVLPSGTRVVLPVVLTLVVPVEDWEVVAVVEPDVEWDVEPDVVPVGENLAAGPVVVVFVNENNTTPGFAGMSIVVMRKVAEAMLAVVEVVAVRLRVISRRKRVKMMPNSSLIMPII